MYATVPYSAKTIDVVIECSSCITTMPSTIHGIKKRRNRSNENFKKRWQTMLRRAYQMQRDDHADVYLVLRRRGQLYLFTSTTDEWPPSSEKIVSTDSGKGKIANRAQVSLISSAIALHSHRSC